MSAMTPDPTHAGRAIAYVIGTYPVLTTTFIDREIRAIRQQGLPLEVVSIRPPTAQEAAPGLPEAVDEVHYLLPVAAGRVAGALVRWLARRPMMVLGLLAHLLTRPHPTLAARGKTLLHFVEGVLAAEVLAGRRVGHVHAHFADRAAVVAWVAARLLGVQYSLFAHANDIYVAPVLLPEKLANASFVATCTAFNRAHLQAVGQGRLARPVELIYHGLDLTALTAAGRHPATPARVLSVGQLREKKGHGYLIQACARLRDLGLAFTCEIIGEGPQRAELEALIHQLHLADRVRLVGALPHPQVVARFQQATVFVLASVEAGNADRDGIPNVFLEAMALGVPVVGSRLSGIPELIEDRVNGRLVAPGEVTALTEAMAAILEDPALAARLATEGRQTVERNFDIDRNIRRLVELFEQALRLSEARPR